MDKWIAYDLFYAKGSQQTALYKNVRFGGLCLYVKTTTAQEFYIKGISHYSFFEKNITTYLSSKVLT